MQRRAYMLGQGGREGGTRKRARRTKDNVQARSATQGVHARAGREGGHAITHLHEAHRPRLDVPLPLRHAPHIVVDEQALRRDPQHQAVRHRPRPADQLRDRQLGERARERVHRLQHDLVRVRGRVRPAHRRRGGRARRGLRR